ncbi:MAG TPA: hypothetical protein VJP89_22450 [Pyrinomonadaceae bacterium]|nr:hypothetical protein [Pyrinomonadaceae bacterium]
MSEVEVGDVESVVGDDESSVGVDVSECGFDESEVEVGAVESVVGVDESTVGDGDGDSAGNKNSAGHAPGNDVAEREGKAAKDCLTGGIVLAVVVSTS